MRRRKACSLCGAIMALFISAGRAEVPPGANRPPADTNTPETATVVPSSASLGPSTADEPDAQTATSRLAVIDLGKIYAESRGFKKLYDALFIDVQRANEELRTRQAKQQARAAELAALSSDDPEYAALAEQVATEMARLQSQVARQKTEFVDREAKLFRDALLKIKEITGEYALAHDLRLVLQFSQGDRSETPEAIQCELTKSIVFQRGIDITAAVLRALNKEPHLETATVRTAAKENAEPRAADEAWPIATLDLNKVLSKNAAIQQLKEKLEADAEAKQAASRDENAIDADDDRGLSNRKSFSPEEAELYLAAYREIQEQVTALAREKKLALVLHFNGEPLDVETPEGLKAELTKMVLYQHGIDITDEVIERVFRRANAAP